MHNDTIVAIATPPGRGGVGIVRVSGQHALSIAQRISKNLKLKPRYATFSSFFDSHDVLLDSGIVLYFKAPHSFTGQDVIEFQCHGSPIVLNELVKTCSHLGARLARPGEFSERAFLNDKMDLAQAEAVADLIDASSIQAARMAIRSLQGEFSDKIKKLNQDIIYLRMYVEAAIDFPEEEVDFLSDGKVAGLLTAIIYSLQIIRASAAQGALLREGLTVVIAGHANAGKSTLINALAQKDVAIVTNIAGTTRDVMREQILIDDIPVHIVDTAGLRETDDIIEKEGIRRAFDEVSRADCVLLMSDVSSAKEEFLAQSLQDKLPKNVPILYIKNKIDKLGIQAKQEGRVLFLSAKTGDGLQILREQIKHIVGYQASEGLFSARRRHLLALDNAYECLLKGQSQLQTFKAGELLAQDLNQAHQILGEITGEFSADDLLGKIFSSFCIGK